MAEQSNWYVVRTFSGHEKKVKEYLEEEIEEQGFDHKITEIFIPTETVVEIRSGKKKTREKNFFPGYILVETMYDESVNQFISSAPSVIGFLKTNKSNSAPTPLKPAEVDRIIGRVSENKELAEQGGLVEIPFKEGDVVNVVDGPFKNFEGTVQEVFPEKLKLRVLVSIFGRKTPVEVDVNQVEPE
jgi:transcriptional antiterminator NusG